MEKEADGDEVVVKITIVEAKLKNEEIKGIELPPASISTIIHPLQIQSNQD